MATLSSSPTPTAILRSLSSLLSPSPSSSSHPLPARSNFASSTRARMSSSAPIRASSDSSLALPPLPEQRIVLGCGSAVVDMLAAVAAFPKPDDKIRSQSLKIQGGGNAGNALTCAARLGLNPRIISKIADDPQGRGIIEELQSDGVDTSFLVVAKEGNSPFTYIIVDNQTRTRTCIHTPGYPPMVPDELSESSLSSAIDGARVVYFDVRLHETAIVVAHEAKRRNIPILVDAEKKRDGLDELLTFADYVVCSARFPQRPRNHLVDSILQYIYQMEWTGAGSVPGALLSMLLRLPNVKFIIVTLGEDGCIMLQRNVSEGDQYEEIDIDQLLDTLKQRKDENVAIPTCYSSEVALLSADGIGKVTGKAFIGTAEKIPPSELVDTTGAGDAFIGAVLYAICAGMPPEKMLPFAAQVAGAGCRALGARTGLPYRSDPCLASFL